MRDSINHAKNFLDVFKADIENGAYKKIPATQRDKGWGGADVLITSKSKAPAKGGFYPDPQFVVTPHADEVAWLFNKLKIAFSNLLDDITKYHFYGRLADAAISYQKQLAGNEEIVSDLLNSILNEAKLIIEEMDNGRFLYPKIEPIGLVASEVIKLPVNISLPFFAYGLFKPNELAYNQIHNFVTGIPEKVTVEASLHVRDGLPLLKKGSGGSVKGYLIRFKQEDSLEAYETISRFEPKKLYRWEEGLINDNKIAVNCLVGRNPDKGSQPYDDLKYDPRGAEWHSSEDPVFTKALEVVRDVIDELGLNEFESAPPSESFDWNRLFRLQMAYLLLWSAIERYCSLAYGPGLDPEEKIKRLGTENNFKEALGQYLNRKGEVYDSRNLTKFRLDCDNPTQSINYYRQVRNNLSHRGKGAFKDGEMVRCSLKELLDIFQFILKKTTISL